ncbi:acetolactate synthase 2 catalytic subunit [Hahella sp. CCB-MM4]|uniref:acetolactate synthase 2 catalytic subunit n=1 Tax=Hahella sp. (strain CCB-MM4) TaxID=1926491 RepID=UPI000B9C6521|nr:acetolactate synthase 2 catalytic subunit [Hahella sp. CCB-MM4]OZG75364.1 acetolactate synthase 2 catalytic subunit [Hahella sp. CCB-MM4]
MNGAQAIINALEAYGTRTIFGYPGGCIMPLYDALIDSSLEHILCRHEQAAALAADGFARASGQLGVCVATSGPGATNLITGVANAFMDSIPMLVITGQVPAGLIGTDAFQETDILGMTLGIVKHSYLVESADDLPEIMQQAISLATSGRPGPVWIDIPKDILLQNLSVEIHTKEADQTGTKPGISTSELIAQAAAMIAGSQKPLLYSGGGVIAANAIEALRNFANELGIPQVVTLKGIGNPGKNHPLNLGMLGMHGSRAANEAVNDCDLLIAVGARFDDRATGKATSFAPNARIVHLDIDHSEFNKIKTVDCSLHGELPELLQQMQNHFNDRLPIDSWRQHCQELKACKGFIPTPSPDEQAPIDGPEFLDLLSRLAPSDTVIACDVGQHQMWVAQYVDFDHPRQHLSSGGLGTMGFGLPAAMGAQFARPDAKIINISGDGSFMMNLQEMATIMRYDLPIKIVILDNQRLGMVRQQQELFYGQRYSEIDLSDNPEFTNIASAFGLHSLKIEQRHQMRRGIETLLAYPGAMLLHVCIESDTNVWPIVKPGAGNDEMIEPASRNTEQVGTVG